MINLSLEQLLEIHALVLQETGGSAGLRDLGRLEAALATQTQVVFGEELYATPCEKAAALIRGIIADHAFVDGNKRSGMLAGLTFLSINGVVFKAKQGELEDLAVQVATNHLTVTDIAAWLAERVEQ
ncbi:MAG TPA: type II toxin-antitoxin system death-on-curing family toxin [Patescibacteria group bacterium]|nr:type II toxin-antitoxin system death-on-curing family toxin [Patescibacteria group bacterium]